MGKWTPDYTDDVLHFKIKNLVSGAIKRSALEKTEPTITYENFVNDLDTGDSFTTSLIDILVKELAERRTRPCLNDRRLIADRSAKSLRLLATPLRVYHDRSVGRHHPSRRTATLSDYLTIPPVEMDTEEDEDIFESVLENPTTLEGVQTNTDLYDAYANHDATIFRGARSLSPPAEDAQSSVLSHQAAMRNGPWSASTSSSSSVATLTRQPSIRRPIRSRNIDFNNFSLRRRSATRENQLNRAEGDEASEHREAWNRNPQTTRRFFPFVRTRRNEQSDYTWTPELHTASVDDDRDRHWFDIASPIHLEPVSIGELVDATVSDERIHSVIPRPNLPRLRRGGLRAPESILSRHASPVIATPVQPESLIALPGLGLDDSSLVGEPTSYPTPSTEHDGLP